MSSFNPIGAAKVLALPAAAGAIVGPRLTAGLLIGSFAALTVGFLDPEGMKRGRGEAPGHTLGTLLAVGALGSWIGTKLAGRAP